MSTEGQTCQIVNSSIGPHKCVKRYVHTHTLFTVNMFTVAYVGYVHFALMLCYISAPSKTLFYTFAAE